MSLAAGAIVTVLQGLRYSARSFARTPGVTVALLLTIALGIGANAAVYGFVRGLIARDSPLTAVDRLVSLFARDAQRAAGPLSYDEYLTLSQDRATFEWLGAARESQSTLVQHDRSSIVSVAAVTPDLAALFGIPIEKGIVLSHRLWHAEFGATPDVRGEAIRIDGVEARVGGVAPEWLDGLYAGRAVDVWTPLSDASADRRSRNIWIIGRLAPGVSVDAAGSAVNARHDGPGETGVMRYTGMTPDMSDGLSRIALLLGAAAGAVFLISCANVASFLVGRASARSHETAIRVALGASRGQLVRQLLLDSVFVSALGGALGVLLALWTSDLIPALFFERDAETLAFAPDLSGIVVAGAACVGVTIACGLMPLLEIRSDRPANVLRRESAGPSRIMQRLRAALVIAQMTCCCVLLISAGLLVQGFRTALQTTQSHRLGQPILATVEAQPDTGLTYFEAVERTAQAIGGVSEIAWAARLPGTRPVWGSLRIEPAAVPLRDVTIDVASFGPDSLALVVTPPLAGRMFGGRDTALSCRVGVVNKEAADAFFNGDPLGRSIVTDMGQRIEIVGVVAMREKPGAGRHRPTLFYYAEQLGGLFERDGPARFGVPTGPKLASVMLDMNIASPSYFDAMGLSTAAGEIFPERPRPQACRTAVVNQEAAEQYFGSHAVGSAVIDGAGRRTEIVGVVRSPVLRAFQRTPEPAIYLPMSEDFVRRMTIALGVRRADGAMLAKVRQRLEAVPGAMAPPAVRTLDEYLSQTALAPLRIATVLVGAFAITALALGILGLYGALSDAARHRRREFAVRIALGAHGWRVIRQVVGEGGRLVAAGTFGGLLGSVVVARFLTRVTPTSVSQPTWMWMAAPLVLLGAVAIASVLPACRALTVDPLTITREDN